MPRPRHPLLLLLLLACTPYRPGVREDHARVPAVPGQEARPPREAPIWDVRRQQSVGEMVLIRELAQARYILLGERHDNPHHHALQAALVRALVRAGRRPAVALEMLDTGQQPLVDEALRRFPGDPDALARAVAWERSGWPDWALYRPIIAAALDAGLPVVAANLSPAQARQLVREGPSALSPAEQARLGLDAPVPAAHAAEMREELREAHCGQLPGELLGGMVLAQRARDAQMAHRLVEADRGDGAVLITGAGHARVDRGVPAHLARLVPERQVRSVAFVEQDTVEEGTPPSHPFHFIWRTPAVAREDPCAPLRQRAR